MQHLTGVRWAFAAWPGRPPEQVQAQPDLSASPTLPASRKSSPQRNNRRVALLLWARSRLECARCVH